MKQQAAMARSGVASTQAAARGGYLQRKCDCGNHTFGGPCTQCGARDKTVQARLHIGAVNDPLEAQADRISEQVLAAPPSGVARMPNPAAPRIDRLQSGSASGMSAPASVDAVLAGAGRPLEAPVRHDMEQRFGTDFSRVRVHADAAAGRSAQEIHARAYTVGHNVVFGAGQYAPATGDGRRLLAHELTHVLQQSGSPAAGGTIRRAEVKVLPADFIGPPNVDQRRAAASCDIGCGGTLHAMPTFFHASRGAPLASSTGADGIGTALHFQRNSTAAPASTGCSTCTDYKIIQILNTNQTSDPRAKESYVDNASGATPFYGDAYLSGAGLHTIPAGYTDAGSDVRSTHSIYDRPFRAAGALAGATGKNFFWNAEACVTCLRPTKDKVLGCASYGFKRAWDAAASRHGPVEMVGPGCRASPSTHFVNTLKSDTSTSSYQFET